MHLPDSTQKRDSPYEWLKFKPAWLPSLALLLGDLKLGASWCWAREPLLQHRHWPSHFVGGLSTQLGRWTMISKWKGKLCQKAHVFTLLGPGCKSMEILSGTSKIRCVGQVYDDSRLSQGVIWLFKTAGSFHTYGLKEKGNCLKVATYSDWIQIIKIVLEIFNILQPFYSSKMLNFHHGVLHGKSYHENGSRTTSSWGGRPKKRPT